MPVIILYLLRLSIALATVWLFYRCVLRRLTFFSWNRWYLLGYSLLCFAIPLINIDPWLPGEADRGGEMVRFIPIIGTPPVGEKGGFWFRTLSGWNGLLWLLGAGACVLALRLGARWLSLVRVRRRARKTVYLYEAGGQEEKETLRIPVYEVEEPILPFSYGKAIYINGRQHTEKEWESIILHEYVHIRQRHTADMLAAEWICILNWYNPFAWLIRHAIRQNLEFIADRQVLEGGCDRKRYQYHLLQVVGDPVYRLANNFNFSSLKKRIIMMNKIKSARVHLVRFLFALPLAVVLLLAFRDPRVADVLGHRTRSATEAGGRGDTVPGPGEQAKEAALAQVEGGVARTMAAEQTEGSAMVQAEEAVARGMDTTPDERKVIQMKAVRDAIGVKTVILLPVQPDETGPAELLQTLDQGDHHPLYIVDGQTKADWKNANSIPADSIYSVNVYKKNDQQTLSLFGEQAAYGVVAILTKGFSRRHPPIREVHFIAIPPPGKDTLKPGSRESSGQRATFSADLEGTLYIVGGTEMTAGELTKAPVNPRDIESIRVLKGAEATEKYGDKARNGAVIIELKNQNQIQLRLDTVRFLSDTLRLQMDQLHLQMDQLRQRTDTMRIQLDH